MDGTTRTYKVTKEAFVSGMTGSSILHINLVLAVGLVLIVPFQAKDNF